MEKSDRKRPRPDDDENTSSSPPPPYGSKEYWENRYKRLQQEGLEKSGEGEEAPDPFHAWYFNYEELAPIILPLILGDPPESDNNIDFPPGSNAAPQENENGHSAKERHNVKNPSKSTEKIKGALTCGDESRHQTGHTTGEDTTGNVSISGDSDDDDDDELLEIEGDEDEDDDEGQPARSGLAKDGPIEILEVGCGDVPLGKDIIAGIQELEKAKDTTLLEKVLKRVICIDYSANLIESMRLKDKSDQTVPLEYECADARKLPYATDRFQFVVEKGTMDAMLSDLEKGSDDCRAIVAEMARVVARGGSIMVISHINAHTEYGMDWLNNIVIPGLRKGGGRHTWSVEVHGSDVPENADDDESPGPAVYIIHKGDIENDSSTVDGPGSSYMSLRFFSY